MVSTEILQFVGYLLLWTSHVIFFTDEILRRKAQKDYETAFLEQHREKIDRQRNDANEYIQLTFPHQENENLLKLCTEYRSKWTLAYYVNRIFPRAHEQAVQIQYLNFRWIEPSPRPVRVQVLRCTQTFALIETGDGLSGYVLEGKFAARNNGQDPTHYNIESKFYYKKETPQPAEGTELPPRNQTVEENLQPSQISSFQAGLTAPYSRTSRERTTGH